MPAKKSPARRRAAVGSARRKVARRKAAVRKVARRKSAVRKVARRKAAVPKEARRKPAAPRPLKLSEKARRVASRFVRFGERRSRRGRYVVPVLDSRGRKVGEVPWTPTVRSDVRDALAAVQGEAPRRLRKALQLPGWNLERGSYDPETATARWIAPVFSSRRGIPVGVPGGRMRGKRKGRSGKYLGEVFENIDPWVDWPGLIEGLPRRFAGHRSNIRCRVTVRDRDGNLHVVTGATDWFPGTLQIPQHYRALLADALSQAGQAFGYAGAVELIKVDLVLASEAAAEVEERERSGFRLARRAAPKRKKGKGYKSWK